MPPHGVQSRKPPGGWTVAELEVMRDCLRDEAWLKAVAPSLEAGRFPEFSARDGLVKDGEYHSLCVALSKAVHERQGAGNGGNLRPFASVQMKLQEMLARAREARPDVDPEAQFADFDMATLTQPPSGQAAPASNGDADGNSAAVGTGALGPPHGGEFEHPTRDQWNITFQTRILNPHLVCTLCNGYYRDACTIIECLHSFCRGCITRHLAETESSTCPTCETPLRGTHQQDMLRADRTLQSIVDKIFRRADPPSRKRPASPDEAAARPPPPVRPPAATEISFSLKREGPEDASDFGGAPLEKPFLRTSSMLTMSGLRKYLAKKMRLDDTSVAIEIACRASQLDDGCNLETISREYWDDPDEDIVLEYRLCRLGTETPEVPIIDAIEEEPEGVD